MYPEMISEPVAGRLKRRSLLQASVAAGAMGALAATAPRAWADDATVSLPFDNGVRPIVAAGTFPGKGEMILQRTRAPLLETPWDVFRQHLFIPNDRAYVRWHMADFPTSVDPGTFRLKISGAVDRPYELTLAELVNEFAPRKLAAVNQCSGNSRGHISPRVAGAQWNNGAMYNAMYTGVPLSVLLAKAGVKPSATHVAFRSLEQLTPPYPAADRFEKVLPLGRANDGDVMVAYEMNGDTFPLLNGFPTRLVVPGWYSTYWVKMVHEIEVMEHPGEGFWMKVAYKVPNNPTGAMTPGQKGVDFVPISAMVPRSFITSHVDGDKIQTGRTINAEGFAFGGNSAVKAVEFSSDGGATYKPAVLGKNWGKYGNRAWRVAFEIPKAGAYTLMVRATNEAGQTQPKIAAWNPGGFMYNAIEQINVVAS
ncbi:MAG: sulfide dehydrogenase [Rhodospirillales bacterium 20-60-12]|nr:MAG: sulfide dehydrogenase [Rhodospirillales bacterium 20-60-12]